MWYLNIGDCLIKVTTWAGFPECIYKNNNFLLPIKIPQGANNLIQWLKWLETYKDTCKHTHTKKQQENIFMFIDCTARSEPIKYHHKSIHI
jgi:hypothetical protein